MKHLLTIAAVAIIAIVLSTSSAQAVEITWPEPNWPEIFEPNQLLTLNLEMEPNDWDTIRLNGMLWDDVNQVYYTPDDPNIHGLEVPAWFWMDGEEDKKIVVAVRQKSCDPLGDANDRYFKISFKIDINQYYGVDPNAATDWHDLKKLSLENGDDVDVLAEGVACNIHRMASGPEGYGYDNWYANWVKLYVNGVYRGVYVNQEQRDKQFMRHRGLYIHSETWLYKQTGQNSSDLKVGDDAYPVSPGVQALNYTPFDPPNAPPDDANLVADMNQWVNMQGMLSMAATNAFVANPDSLFNHYNNAYFVDFNLPNPSETRKRMYFPWDQDSVMRGTDAVIYKNSVGETTWQQIILSNPTFHSQYNQIMRDLINGPLSEADIHAFLDTIETDALVNALAADQFNNFDTPGAAGVTERFDQIKDWYSPRIVNVLDQVFWDEPPEITLLRDGFEQAVWNANWSGNWLEDNATYSRGYASAAAVKNNDGYFTCNALDANDATAIHIGFWFMKDKDVGAGELLLYYYNGTSYNQIVDLDTLGGKDKWLHYTDVITDSNYFDPNFGIRFEAVAPYNKEEVWVDDVVVAKLITTPNSPVISGYVLDPKGAPIEGVLVSADNGGGSDTTDPNGYYEVVVPYGWSNASQSWSSKITPTKEDYTFTPPEQTYRNVVVGQWDQDYKGTSIYDLNGDGFIDFADFSVFASAWRSSLGDANWNAACDFDTDIDVDWNDLAKFVLVWVAL